MELKIYTWTLMKLFRVSIDTLMACLSFTTKFPCCVSHTIYLPSVLLVLQTFLILSHVAS